ALHADHVIVMLVVVEMFVARDSIGKIDLACKAAIRQQFHRPIYGCISDARVRLARDTIDVLHAAMTFMLQECIEDQLPMRSQLQFVFLQVLHEDLHFRRKNLHGADCDGISLRTSLYSTMTMSIRI